MRTFARFFGIAFGIAGGVLAAVLVVGAVAFAGYSIYRADQDRRAEEQARARATVVAHERATATTVVAQQQATAAARQLEDEQRKAAAAATAEAVRLAARRCEDPGKLVTTVTPELFRRSGSSSYFVSGIVRNTCNYDIVFNLHLTALAANGSTIIATKTIAINAEGVGREGERSTLIRPGEERLYRAYFIDRSEPDVALVRVAPVIVREGDPP